MPRYKSIPYATITLLFCLLIMSCKFEEFSMEQPLDQKEVLSNTITPKDSVLIPALLSIDEEIDSTKQYVYLTFDDASHMLVAKRLTKLFKKRMLRQPSF